MTDITENDVARTDADDELNVRELPPTPPSPDDLENADSKSSRKREREVSLEPGTPRPDEPTSEEPKERRRPATKKNRVKLGPTAEEDETPPTSPSKAAVELSTSPPHETKVRQISMQVRGLKWDDKAGPEFSQEANTSADMDEAQPAQLPGVELEPAAELSNTEANAQPMEGMSGSNALQTNGDTPNSQEESSIAFPSTTLTRTATMESDSDDQEKRLKRKMGDRIPSSNGDVPPTPSSAEPGKRARDDRDEDANPREKKRPTPPPEERDTSEQVQTETSTEPAEPVAPQPKLGGFLAYASTSSPFASAKGRSIFAAKTSPSPAPLAGTSNGAVSSLSSGFQRKLSPSPFSLASTSKANSTSKSAFGSSALSPPVPPPSPKDATSPTGTKRSGFEAFASSSSPFISAAVRSKSPTGFPRSNAAAGLGLARSKSPARRAPGASNAFKSYMGSGTQSFAAPSPPVKKQRQDSNDDTDASEAEKAVAAGGSVLNNNVLNNGASPEGSEEEAEKPATSFSDRLRAGKNDEEEVDEEEKVAVTEQEVHTGEEDDETIFQVRGKLYALSEQNAWKERGTGLLKLNVRKSDGGGARLLMRKEAVYTLLLNVTLFKGMRCTLAQDPRYLRFSCIEDNAIVHYNLRLANAKVAGELLEEIKTNIPGDEPSDTV